ncbi:MAG: hypothetical protein ACFN4D_03535, partial [Cardiobacterium sp.]
MLENKEEKYTPLLKTCPCFKGIATLKLLRGGGIQVIKNLSLLQRDCDFWTSSLSFCRVSLKICPCFKGIATYLLLYPANLVQLKTWWCPKMYAASNKSVVDIEKSDGKCLNVIEHLLGKTAG